MAGIRLISKADTSGIVKMSNAVAGFRTSITAAKTSVAPFLKLGGAFIGFGIAIEASLGLAAAAAINYEYLIQRIATSSRLASSDIATLHDRFLTLSTTMATGADDLAKLGFTASKLSLDAAGIEKFVKAGAQLNTISGGAITGEEAIGRIGRISKVFGLDLAGNVDKVASAFVGLARVSTATESEIAAVVSRTAELGKSVGFTIPDLAALAASAKDVGLDARRASGAIEELIEALKKKDSARMFARQLHMTGEEFRNALGKNPMEILGKLQGAFKGLDPRLLDEQFKLMNITSASTKTLVLGLADAHSTLSKNVKVANDEFRKGTAAQEAYAELINTTKMQLQIFWNSIKAVAIAFGEILLPPLKLALEIGTFFMQLVLAIPKPLKILIVIVAALTSGLLILTGSIITVLAATIAFKIAVGKAAEAVYYEGAAVFETSFLLQSFAGSMLESAAAASYATFGFLTTQFGAESLGAQIAMLSTALFEGSMSWGAYSAGVYEAAAATFSFEMLTGIGEALLVIAAAVAVGVVAWYALKPAIMEVWNAFKLLYTPIQVLKDGISELTGMFGITSGGIGETLMTFIRIGLLPIIMHLKGLALVVRIVASVFTGMARGVIAVLRPIVEPFVRLYNLVKSIVQPVLDMFNAFAGPGSEAVSIFENLASAGEFAFKWLSPLGIMLQVAGGLFQAFAFVVENVWDGIISAFAPLVDEIQQGVGAISSMWGELVGDFMKAIDPIRQLMSEWVGGGEGVTAIIKGIGSVIKWLVSAALWPIVTLFRIWNALFAVISAMAITVGKVLVYAFTPVFWVFKQIANIISEIIAAWKWWTGSMATEGPAIAKAVGKPLEDVQNASAIGMAHVETGKNLPLRNVAPVAHSSIQHFALPRNRSGTPNRPRGGFKLAGHMGEDVPRVNAPANRIASAIGATTAAVTRSSSASSGGGSSAPMNITIPVSVMLDGDEIGKVVVAVNDETIRRQFGKRAQRFSGVG